MVSGQNCSLTDGFAVLVQVSLAAIAFSSLLSKNSKKD
jgi:hypothetical protein